MDVGENNEQLGIENLKVALIAAINLAEKIEDKYSDDGKISLSEALSVGVGSFTDVVKVVRSGKQIKAEFEDLSDDEKETLLLVVKEELDLDNDKIENIVEKSLEFLISLEELIAAMRE